MIDFNKPLKTRSGLNVRIICTDRKGDWPVIGLVEVAPGKEQCLSWKHDGRAHACPGEDDLVNTPVVVERFQNVYSVRATTTLGKWKTSLEDANRCASSHRQHVIKATWEDSKMVKVEIVQ